MINEAEKELLADANRQKIWCDVYVAIVENFYTGPEQKAAIEGADEALRQFDLRFRIVE